MNILEINSLCKKFGNIPALNNLDFFIEKGSVAGLVGPNGAGKSTTINCIADIVTPDSGKISIFGMGFNGKKIDIKKRIGIAFENSDELFIYLTGEEYLKFVGKIYGIDRQVLKDRINDLLTFFDLKEYQSILINDYSKGMKKKMALASLFLHDPEFLVLDEPFDGLDMHTILKLTKLLKRAKEHGRTVLITTHILSYIEKIADDVSIINNGSIIFRSKISEIKNKIKNNLTKETYQSLEEIFVSLTEDSYNNTEELSWI